MTLPTTDGQRAQIAILVAQGDAVARAALGRLAVALCDALDERTGERDAARTALDVAIFDLQRIADGADFPRTLANASAARLRRSRDPVSAKRCPECQDECSCRPSELAAIEEARRGDG